MAGKPLTGVEITEAVAPMRPLLVKAVEDTTVRIRIEMLGLILRSDIVPEQRPLSILLAFHSLRRLRYRKHHTWHLHEASPGPVLESELFMSSSFSTSSQRNWDHHPA
jgi:hypothetical protein